MTTMIGDETSCARGPRVQVLPTGCFYLEGVALDFCTFPGGESRGHVDGSGSVRMPARRQVGMPRETRQLLPLYRHTRRTRARKKGGSSRRIIRYRGHHYRVSRNRIDDLRLRKLPSKPLCHLAYASMRA